MKEAWNYIWLCLGAIGIILFVMVIDAFLKAAILKRRIAKEDEKRKKRKRDGAVDKV